MLLRMRAISALVALPLMIACAAEEEPLATSSGTVVVDNRIAANRIAANRIALNALSENRIARNDLLLDGTDTEVFAYVVSCALRAGQTITATFEGTTHTFEGEIGLAPKWVHRALNASERRWVSACLIARVNKYEVSVPISIHGPHSALSVSKDEAQTYTVEEGAFYGDVFRPVGEPIVWVACRGRDQAAGETGQLDDRDCAEPDPTNPGFTQCGFTYAGDCADFEPPRSAYACKKFVDRKHGGGGGWGWGHNCGWKGWKKWKKPHHRLAGDVGVDVHGDVTAALDADELELALDDPDHVAFHEQLGDADDEVALYKHGHHKPPGAYGYYKHCHDEPGKGKWHGATRYAEVVTVFVTP